MPRNPSGVYVLPAGNPVVSGTVIESTWANSTLNDVATGITGSLPRDGSAGMSAPLILYSTTVALPQEAVPLAQVQSGYLPKVNPSATGDFTLTDTDPRATIQVTLTADTSVMTLARWGSSLGGGGFLSNAGGPMTVGTTSNHATIIRAGGVDVVAVTAAPGVAANVYINGTTPRIRGDMSNAMLADRLMFQSSTVNGATDVGVAPNGTSTTSGITAYNADDPTNASTTTLQTTSTQSKLIAGKTGTGNYLPLSLNVGGFDYFQLSPTGLLSGINGGGIAFTQAGTGAVVRMSQDKMCDTFSAKDFGVVGDGVTSDYTKSVLALAASAGRKIIFPAGTYKLPFSSAVAFSPPANCVIEGDGVGLTLLRFEPDSATFRNLFRLSNGNVTFRNLSISVVALSTQQLVMFNIAASGINFENCDFDGGMTNTGTVLSHTAHCFGFATAGTQTDLNVESCALHRFSYGVLKTNASTSTQKRIAFTNCDLYGNYAEDLGFNSPNGVMDDVQVNMCRFRNGSGSAINVQQIYCSFASVSEFSVTGNTFEDVSAEALHIEENCRGGVISGNTINVDGTGIVLTDNNIGGASKMPQNISITGNTIRKSGTLKFGGSYGISLAVDASPEVPCKNTVVSGNTISGFDAGIVSGTTLDDGCRVDNNEIDTCTNGIFAQTGSMNFFGNTSKSCDTGVYSTTMAVFDNHTFISCTVNADAVTRPMVLLDPVFTFPEFSIGAGGVIYSNLLSLGANDRVHGFLNTTVWTETISDRGSRRDETTWDGTTFTRTNKIIEQPGGITVDTVRNASILAVQIFSTSARSTVSAQSKLHGMVVVAV